MKPRLIKCATYAPCWPATCGSAVEAAGEGKVYELQGMSRFRASGSYSVPRCPDALMAPLHTAHARHQLHLTLPAARCAPLACAVAGRRSGTYREASPRAITSFTPITRRYESTASLEGRPPGWYGACDLGSGQGAVKE